MSEPTPVVSSAPPAKRNRLKRLAKWLGIYLVVLACIGFGIRIYFLITSSGKLDRVIAELDRLDPGWRWDELDAKQTKVPDAENSLLCVEAVGKLLTEDWFKELDAPEGLTHQLAGLQPCTQLGEQQINKLHALLEKAKPAVAEAQRLATLSQGWRPIPVPDDLSGVVGTPRKVGKLMFMNAVSQAQDQKVDGAMDSVRCMINTGRSEGDLSLAM